MRTPLKPPPPYCAGLAFQLQRQVDLDVDRKTLGIERRDRRHHLAVGRARAVGGGKRCDLGAGDLAAGAGEADAIGVDGAAGEGRAGGGEVGG